MKKITLLALVMLAAAVRTEAQQRLALSLEQCRQMALEHSEALRQADNALRTAELDRRIATTAMLPSFEGSATGAYMLPDMDMMGTELLMRGTYMAGITLTQPIYTGGKITSARRLTRIGEEAAAEQLRMTRMDVVAEADNVYWTLMAVESKVAMMEGYAAMLDTLHRQTSVAVDAGMTIANDLLRVEARRSDIEYQLQKVRNGADLCRMSLCRIIGADAGTQIELTETAAPAIAGGELSADMEARPELRLLPGRWRPAASRCVCRRPICCRRWGCRWATPTMGTYGSGRWSTLAAATICPTNRSCATAWEWRCWR